jgi:hypothetical protein
MRYCLGLPVYSESELIASLRDKSYISNSPTLSGAQASSTQSNSSKPDLRHYEMYRSSAIVKQWTEKEATSLKTEEDCRMAMVWIALLGGGDYAPEGLTGFGEFINFKCFGRTQPVVI